MSKPQNLTENEVLPPMHIWAYHRTKDAINAVTIAHNGFSDERIANGSTYGVGFYLSRSLEKHLACTNYGKHMLKSYVDMNNVLIIDREFCIQLHGKPISIIKQIYDKGIRFKEKGEVRQLSSWSDEFDEADNSSLIFGKLLKSTWFKIQDHFDGVAYVGKSDGPCIVMYNHKKVFPVSWTTFSDDAINELKASYLKINYPKLDKITLKKYATDCDVSMDLLLKNCANEINWHNLNVREVQKVRAGLQPRFLRIVTMLKSRPDTATVRLNQFFSKMNYENFCEFLNALKGREIDYIRSIMNEESENILTNIVEMYPNINNLVDKLNSLKSINWSAKIWQKHLITTVLPKIEDYINAYELDNKFLWFVQNWNVNNIFLELAENMSDEDRHYSVAKILNPYWVKLLKNANVLANDEYIQAVATQILPLQKYKINIIEYESESIDLNLMLVKTSTVKNGKTKVKYEDDGTEEDEDCDEDEDEDEDDYFPSKRKSRRR